MDDATTTPAPGPIETRERVAGWDLARGIAVLGVLLANMPWMSLPEHLAGGGMDPGKRAFDGLCYTLVALVADGKFITQFSLLFGAGLEQMRSRALARGANFTAIGVRRLLTLAVVGLAHGLLLWFGDILLAYAVLAFPLLLLLPRRPKALAIAAIALLAIGFASWTIGTAIAEHEPPATFVDDAGTTHSGDDARDAMTAHYADVFSSGDFVRMTKLRAQIVAEMFKDLLLMIGPRTLGLFALGAWLVRRGILARPSEHRRLLFRWFVFGVPFGLAAMAATLLLDRPEATGLKVLQVALLDVGTLVQGLGYLAGAMLWSLSDRPSGLRDRLTAVGRMAFTNYIAHSVLTAIVFNYGGLYGHVSRLFGLGVAFAIFALQLAWSPWWLARFRFGPLEWLWRQATYLERIPLRR